MISTEQQRLYKFKADVIAAMGNPIRLAAIDFLRDGEQCVCDISDHIGAQRSNVSRHLAILLNAGVVDHRKDGLKMMYSLKTPCILNFLKCVEGVLTEKAKDAASILKAM